MNFYSKFTTGNVSIANEIDENLHQLFLKLKSLDLASIGISEYNQKYLGEYVIDSKKISWFLSHIFMLVVEQGKNIKELTIIDYGGGSGILSYLAKELGVGTVIYNDIYEVSCVDVGIISKALKIEINHIIHGDVLAVTEYINKHQIAVDIIIAHDVIEHIYDVNRWFAELCSLKSKEFTIICTSHANQYNPLIRNKLEKAQLAIESKNRERSWGHKERDTLESFLEIRRNWIGNHAPDLDKQAIDSIARQTRGLIIDDIRKELDTYFTQGIILYKPNHRTNTCDPNTGNWIEQLIDLQKLKNELDAIGYSSKISSGFYISSKGSFMVKYLKQITNYIIHYLRFKGLFLSPYYVIVSKYKRK
jgi:2-polyprenyl-3-methyl-5-hydroxy-6-metoxy-1,4-benzoquinol methylase